MVGTRDDRFALTTNDEGIAYLKMPPDRVQGRAVVRSVLHDLRSIVPGYRGPDLVLDLADDGTLMGIELLY